MCHFLLWYSFLMTSTAQVKEWLKQVEYDFKTAEVMLKGGRYIYCVFMCHLSLEKMLKVMI